jgi:hypothetical protein
LAGCFAGGSGGGVGSPAAVCGAKCEARAVPRAERVRAVLARPRVAGPPTLVQQGVGAAAVGGRLVGPHHASDDDGPAVRKGGVVGGACAARGGPSGWEGRTDTALPWGPGRPGGEEPRPCVGGAPRLGEHQARRLPTPASPCKRLGARVLRGRRLPACPCWSCAPLPPPPPHRFRRPSSCRAGRAWPWTPPAQAAC